MNLIPKNNPDNFFFFTDWCARTIDPMTISCLWIYLDTASITLTWGVYDYWKFFTDMINSVTETVTLNAPGP